MKIPFPRSIVIGVLGSILAAGGSYGGYKIFKDDVDFGPLFGAKLHYADEVVDGDTFVTEDGARVRLIGIDAPEIGSCFAEEAQTELARLILGNELELRKDESGEDGYGRLLRYVFVYNENPKEDNLFVNVELVRGGFVSVRYIKPDKEYLARLQAAEREAQNDEKGMWGACGGLLEEFALRKTQGGEQASETFDKECVIKGNISKSYGRDYFLPGCPNYKRVKVDPRKGEMWFCSEDEAREAGWTMSAACSNIHQFSE